MLMGQSDVRWTPRKCHLPLSVLFDDADDIVAGMDEKEHANDVPCQGPDPADES